MTAATRQSPGYTPDLSAELRRAGHYDFPLLAAVVLLLGLGIVLVYSATVNEDALRHGDGMHHVSTHLGHVGLGLIVMVGAFLFDYRRWRPLVYPMLLGVVLLLLLVIAVGTTAGHARRWISLFGLTFQPAELAKFAFVVFLAYSLAKKGQRIREFTVAFVPHLIVCGVLILLCLFQPDFGTSVILVVLMFTMLFVAGTRLSYITLFGAVGSFLAFQAIATNDMRLGRVLAFIDPWAHRAGRGYQMVNSLIAIGSGGVTGQGIGNGGQTLTGFLPEGHTDFILSVAAEQMGLLGVLVVVGLFLLILVRGLGIAARARDEFGRFLAFGLTLLLLFQAVTNMLVAVAMIPTKGLTLPFVSWGGSSMVVSCLAAGILLNISHDTRRAELARVFGDPAPSAEPKRARKPRRRRRAGRVKAQSVEEVLG